MFSKKGQVSTEYLIILAVVLVVALVVVYLVGGFSGLGAGSLETQSKDYWAGASPMSVNTVKASGTTLQLEMINNDIDPITVTGISVEGGSVFSTATTFNSGQDEIITGTLATTCGATGSPFQLNNVSITYTKDGISGLQEVGAKGFVGVCS